MIKKNIRYYFHSKVAKLIISAIIQKKSQITISLDLNKTATTYNIVDNKLVIDNRTDVDLELLQSIVKKKNRVFFLESNRFIPLEFRENGYYKLVPTNHAPTFEISGVKMHRSKDYDPFIDAKEKVSEVVKKGHRVLDTCGGLGYTAIWSKRLGAQEVISIERDQFVINLRNENPWSSELSVSNISVVWDDVSKYINKFNNSYFDSIIHDPPRISLSGELYGMEFYSELFRVLKKKGVLFHYTGNPHIARKGNTFFMNTIKRLKKIGFYKVIPKIEFLGMIAFKK